MEASSNVNDTECSVSKKLDFFISKINHFKFIHFRNDNRLLEHSNWITHKISLQNWIYIYFFQIIYKSPLEFYILNTNIINITFSSACI